MQMEVRREDNGEVVYRDHLSCSVSAVLRADYRNDGMESVIVCGIEGEVRGGRGKEIPDSREERSSN